MRFYTRAVLACKKITETEMAPTEDSTVGEANSNYAYYVLESCKKNRDKTLLVMDGEPVTGLQMHQRISAAVYQLRANGVVSGDRVLITMMPSIDFYALAVAAFSIGGCLVVLDPSMGLERANHCIGTAAPSAWVMPSGSWFKYLKLLVPALRSVSIHVEVESLSNTKSGSSTGEETRDKVQLASDRVVALVEPQNCVPVENALVTFTTGSTGLPKLMLRQHRFVLNQSRSISHSYASVMEDVVGIPEREAVYCTNLPFFALNYMMIGATSLVFPNIAKIQPAKVIDAMKKYGVTSVTGSPAFIHKLASHTAKLGVSLPVKSIIVGGAPVFRGMFRTIASATPEKKAIVLYGSTEVEPVSAIFAEEKLRLEAEKPDGHCVGRPVFEDSARIIEILSEPPSEPVDISTLELPRGEIGEIVVSGWHVNTHQVDEKRLVRDVDGRVWLRIEDAGYMDQEGRIWLVGRVKWRVERDGKTFWSTAVEQKVLDRCSVVTFAAYLPHKGEAWLFIEAPQGLPTSEESALKQFLLTEGIPVDHLVIKSHIPKDRRHLSKPNTAVLFAPSAFNRYTKLVAYLLRSNPLLTLVLIVFQLSLIFAVIFLLILS